MKAIIISLFWYFGVSLAAFYGIWKDCEDESEQFNALPQKGKVLCRLFAILLWPIYFIPCALTLVYILLKRLYDSIIE